MSARPPAVWANRLIFAVFLVATAVGAWIGVLYPISPHASEIGLPRRD